jgi:hypothetical protein
MKQRKPPSITDLIEIINEKKVYLFLFFLTGVLISTYITTKNSSKYLMNFKLIEQYFPISDEIKSQIRSKFLISINDKNELAIYSPNEKLKKKLLNKSLKINAELNSKNITGEQLYSFEIKVTGNDLETSDQLFFSDSIVELFKNLEKDIKEEMIKNLSYESSVKVDNFLEKLSSVLALKSNDDLEVKINSDLGDLVISLDERDDVDLKELLNLFVLSKEKKQLDETVKNSNLIDISYLKIETLDFFEIHPKKIQFEKEKVKNETLITIPLLFLFFGVFIFSLNRFF